jgi:hypothetical protein
MRSTLGWWMRLHRSFRLRRAFRLRRGFRLRRATADKAADRTADMGVAWWLAKFDHLPITPALQHSVGLFGVPNSSVSG